MTELRVACCNMQNGGIDPDGGMARWQCTVAALHRWEPDVVLLQELRGPEPAQLYRHGWATANELGMTLLAGPPTPASVTGNHPAILVSSAGGIRITDQGPPPWPPGAGAHPAWCQATLEVPGLDGPLHVYSVHLPSRSSVDQLVQAQRLASLAAERGGHTVAGGDWNSYPRRVREPEITREALAALPPHVRPARLTGAGHAGGLVLHVDYGTADVLESVGLADAAPLVHPGSRVPAGLIPTSPAGGDRTDRFHVSAGLVPALSSYAQADTGGSDHHALLLVVDLGLVA